MPVNPAFGIPPARAEVGIRLALTVFVDGSWAPHAAALTSLLHEFATGRFGLDPVRWRRIADVGWRPFDFADPCRGMPDELDWRRPPSGCRGIEIAGRADADGVAPRLRLVDLAPVGAMPRCSSLHIAFDETASSRPLVSLAAWLIDHLPLWWGSAGLVFEHVDGDTDAAYSRIAALAKRYWSVQLQDVELLQRDALAGMPGIGWLTLVGHRFAAAHGLSCDVLSRPTPSMVRAGVSAHRGPGGVVLAAGPQPVRGDINHGADLSAYAVVADALSPLLLTAHEELFGPRLPPELAAAWLQRFASPQSWLEHEIPRG